MRNYFLLSFFLLFYLNAHLQTYTISGFIEDETTGEKLIGANVYNEKSFKGTITNYYGFYSLTLPAGKILFTISYVGYAKYQQEIDLTKDLTLNIKLTPSLELQEVTVKSNSIRMNVESTQMSSINVPIETAKAMPMLLGESDILKTIQLMPGVQSGNEGTSGLYVRGGGPDQNLFLLDGVPVYNASHLFGFFSVFNADAIQSVQLIKGGYPARYGGRLSSVVDIRLKEGNNKKFKGEGSIGIISSKLTLEGPVKNEKTSFLISGRRTYIDVLTQPIIKLIDNNLSAGYYFYDLNAKINHKFNEKSRLFLSAYMGNDKAYTKFKSEYLYDEIKHESSEKAGLGWGNITTALRWNYIINKKLFSNTTVTYSRYKFSINNAYTEKSIAANNTQTSEYSFEYFSGIDDIAAKIDFDYSPNPNHAVKFGISNTYHTFKPGINVFQIKGNAESENIDTTFGNTNVYANELESYFEDDIKIGSLLKINIGVHYSNFAVKNVFYNSIQPRISSRFVITEDMSLKASFTQMNQNLHLLTNSTIGLPTDLWVPATDKIKPMIAYQYAIGAIYNIKDEIAVTLEGFYKTMDNLIEYKEGASFFSSKNDWEQQIENGRGWSYGGELLIQKDVGKFTGWIGYTLSWNYRQFDNIGFGEKFPYKFDRRHDIGIVISYKLSERIDMGATWVFGTGNAITLAQEKYVSYFSLFDQNDFFNYGGQTYYDNLEHYDNRNGYRMPSYHRLDLGINIHKKRYWGETTWSFGLYNAYNRQNPFYLYFGYRNNYYDGLGNNQRVLKQVSLFPLIPSVRLNFKF
ncbi:MAG: TonB-dependent receptor [Chlorobi bacterium]|nr:TonB-dependent receptor [Chlorobiota bacterium]